ncbi:MAG: HAD family phosphatase [Bacteroidales bacterium]|nr:HAD family phosphatase [Bacteroidales bacterium]
MDISSIIFDFGGVILDIDPQLTIKALRDFGFKEWQKLDSPEFYKEVIFPLEKGLDSPEVFRDKMRNYLQMKLTDEQVNTAWNALLFPLTNERIRLLEKAKKHYAIFLLSNSNFIHYQEFLKDLHSNFGYKQFDDLFDKSYFSFELQLIKPDRKIYDYVLGDQDLDPGQTLFIDDREDNIEGAARTGLKTFHLSNGTRLTDLFDHTGKLKDPLISGEILTDLV